MGGSSSKESFKTAISELITNEQVKHGRRCALNGILKLLFQTVASLGDSFWERYWSDPLLTPNDFFTLISRDQIHEMMNTRSGNLTALCFKVFLIKWVEPNLTPPSWCLGSVQLLLQPAVVKTNMLLVWNPSLVFYVIASLRFVFSVELCAFADKTFAVSV